MGRPSWTIDLGKRYACVYSPEGPLELLVKRVKPYHRKGFSGHNPSLVHWTLPTQTSVSCVSTPRWNSSQHSWADIGHHLQGVFSTNLKGQIDQLQLELHQQLSDIKCLTEQKAFQTLCDNLGWLNPQNWFDGHNLRMWIFGAANCLLILIMLCVLCCICKLFSQGHIREQQVASFVAVLTKNKGGNYREPICLAMANVAQPFWKTGGPETAHRSQTHRLAFPWETRPALYLGCFEACFC